MLWSRSGGRDDGPLLVMLHGLGATGEVWRGVEALLPEAWSGGWLVLDLPGHGRSPWAPAYDFAAQAHAVSAMVPAGREVVLLGHSMGGMVALEVAAGLPSVRRVVAFAVKTWWPPEHVAGDACPGDERAAHVRHPREALARHAKVAGLSDLLAPDDPALLPGITEAGGGWRVAQDPATYDFGTPDIAGAVAALDGITVVLARGSEDPFVRAENLTDLVDDPVTLDGLGHNPHVERPEAVIGLV